MPTTLDEPKLTTERRRTVQSFLLRLVVGLAIVGILIASTDYTQIIRIIRGVNPVYLILACAVQVIGNLISAWRWRVLLDIYDMPIPYFRLFMGLYVGAFFNNLLPTSFGGDFYRSHWVLADKHLYRKSLFVIFIERFIGVITLGYIALPALALLVIEGLRIDTLILPTLLLLVGLCAGGFVLHPAVISHFNRHLFPQQGGFLYSTRTKLANALQILHNSGLQKWKVYLLSMLMQLDGVTYYYVIALAIDIRLSAWYYLIIVPIVVVLTMLPLSFNGLGIREGGLVFVAAAFGLNVSTGQAVALGLLVLGVTMTASLAGAVFYIVSGAEQVRQDDPALIS